MDVLLLSAGLGTRLEPLTHILPKCLMPIHGRPLLSLWLKMLEGTSVERVFVNTHHHSNKVREYVQSSPYRDQVTLLHEEELLGTAGTLAQFSEHFISDDLMVVHADNLSHFDMATFYNAYQSRPQGCFGTMMTFTTDAPKTCGIVTLDDKSRIIAFDEKPADPKSNLANGAVYIFKKDRLYEVLDECKAPKDISLDIIPHFIGKMTNFHNDQYHRDIGNIKAYSRAQIEVQNLPILRHLLAHMSSYWSTEDECERLYECFKEELAKLGLTPEVIALIMKR